MYKLLKNKKTFKFDVVENDTTLVVFSCGDHDVAYEIYKNLNKGFAFDGFTPSFFVISLVNYGCKN